MSQSTKGGRQPAITEKALIVVFGASGDVAKKLAYPSLFALYSDGLLPPKTRIIGYARSDLKEEKFHDQLVGGLKKNVDKSKVEDFKKINQYVRGTYNEDEAFQNLEKELQKIADADFGGESNRMYYLALPPSQFTSLSEKIKKNNYKGKVNRLVIEKPFAKDTESCKEMMKAIMSDWKEEEIYRIDHFLGAEIVRNIPHLRFGNELLIDSLLHKEKVGAVMVELQETNGLEGRGGYFDEFGMIRDVIQNHLLQAALLLAIDKPKNMEYESIQDEKLKVLKAMRPIDKDEAVFGQFVKSGDKAGYLEDDSVENKDSKTETFTTSVIWIDNERWKGVPFILKSGKGLDKMICRIIVQLKVPDSPLFGKESTKPTELIMDMFPQNRIYFNVNSKKPGPDDTQTRSEIMLDYTTAYPDQRTPGPYETVLNAVLQGDKTMFVGEDELIAAWEVYTPLLHYFEGKDSPRPIEYKRGSTGPSESVDLEKKVGWIHV